MMKSSSQLLLGLLLVLCATHAVAEGPSPFVATRLTDRVLVLTEQSPWRSNHVVISSDRGLVLVDPGGSPVVARLLRQAIEDELGHSRIAYVIDHHHHWGHSWGNASFPEAVVIGHEDSLALMERDAGFIAPRVDYFRPQLEEAEKRLAEAAEGSTEAAEAVQLRDQARWMIEGLSEDGFTVRTPDLAFSERLTLDLGNLSLELQALGRGHSETDSVIFIPEERVLLMGCFFLVNDGLPAFGFQPELSVNRWFEVFASILDGDTPVEHVVPGQHALWTPDALRGWRDYIAGTWQQVQSLEAEGVTLAVAQERITLPPAVAELTGGTVDAERLAGYHRSNVERFWRQLKESSAALFARRLDEEGLAAALALYREHRELPAGEVFFSEAEFNSLGYRLLGEQRFTDAIAVFALNVEAFPESWNVYDSLGEAYMLNGDPDRAIELYRRSLEINPNNTNGVAMLERLGVKP